MKRTIFSLLVAAIMVSITACNSNADKQSSNSSAVPPATDTMPVINPGVTDSGSTIKTPPTHDDISVMPDSAIKNH